MTISGQTLASLSQDKPTVTSSVGDNHPGSFAVDGDETTRWIADSGEKILGFMLIWVHKQKLI